MHCVVIITQKRPATAQYVAVPGYLEDGSLTLRKSDFGKLLRSLSDVGRERVQVDSVIIEETGFGDEIVALLARKMKDPPRWRSVVALKYGDKKLSDLDCITKENVEAVEFKAEAFLNHLRGLCMRANDGAPIFYSLDVKTTAVQKCPRAER